MSRPIITLTTDFGEGSSYVAQMKGVILSVNPEATVVDSTHSVPPQDVRQGALVLDDVIWRFPAQTIHVAVVDPGVGTDRAIVLGQFGDQFCIAPDNGLLSRLTRRVAPTQLISLKRSRYWLNKVSSTFHGRDIMAPIAAHVSLGAPWNELGDRCEQLVDLDWPEPRVDSKRITGTIAAIDTYGNLVSDISAEQLEKAAPMSELLIACGGRTISGVSVTYGERPASSLVALIGSSDRLEVSVVGGDAASVLRVAVGDAITVSW